MSNAIKWETAAARTSGISAANLAAGANLLGGEVDNSINRDRWLSIDVAFACSVAPTANTFIEVYALYAVDGTNYEDGDATPTDPTKTPLTIVAARAVTAAQRVAKINLPLGPFKFKILLKSELDQAIDGNSLTVQAYTHNEELQ